MANLGEVFDATTVDPSTSYPVYPADKYRVEIIKSDMMPTKNGDGQFLLLEMAILDGPYKDGKITDRLNLVNQNQTAQEIAQRALSAICHATGVMQVSDSEQLHFKPLMAELRVRPAGPDKSGVLRDAQNEVRGYTATAGGGVAAAPSARPVGGATAPRSTTPAAAKAAAGGAAVAPWRR